MLALIVGVASCELPDNIDPKHADAVPATTLFSNALYELADQTTTIDYNANIGFLLSQYFSEVTYTSESRYDFQSRGITDNYWNNYYRHVLMDLQEARNIINNTNLITPSEKTTGANQLFIIDILEVFVYQNLVDAFGNVPYSEALLGADNPSPKYDDATTIYTDLLARITADISGLDNSEGSFGSADMLYGGNVDSWKAFAASLKLRMAMRLADVNPSASQTAAEAAIASGVFTAQSQSGIMVWAGVSPYVSSFYNWYVERGRKDLAPTELFVNTLDGLNDPRREYLLTLVDTNTLDELPTPVEDPLIYIGMEYGKSNSSSYNSHSHFTSPFFAADFEAILIDYVEVEFLLAEAAERGYTVTGTAASHYDAGITTNINYWADIYGIDRSVVDMPTVISTYLAQTEVDYATAVAATSWKQVLGTQKWIALYNRGNEGFAEYRRFDFPVLIPPADMTQADIPNRYPYPYNEDKLNKENYDAASTAIGGDDASTKLFWDVN